MINMRAKRKTERQYVSTESESLTAWKDHGVFVNWTSQL